MRDPFVVPFISNPPLHPTVLLDKRSSTSQSPLHGLVIPDLSLYKAIRGC